jgi:hypothetical protein
MQTKTKNSAKNNPTSTAHHFKNDTKWMTFTYTSPQIRKITNLFKHTNVQIAFKCNNTISQLSKPGNKTPPLTPYDRSGIYSLTCKHVPTSVCRANQLEPQAMLPRAHKIHYEQQPTISICSAYPPQPA